MGADTSTAGVTIRARGTAAPLGTPPMDAASLGISTSYLLMKRVGDVVMAIAGIVMLSPLWLAVAIAIRITSPGPVFFRQRRVGQYGVPFVILKFRTMLKDAEEHLGNVLPLNKQADHSLIRIASDPRVTQIGKWLRALSLDETPQLFNILRGEMSFVGPRPISRDINDPRGMARLQAMPGLTGMWQVNGRKDTDCEQMLQLDMQYLEQRSLMLDTRILLQTVPVVLCGRGAR